MPVVVCVKLPNLLSSKSRARLVFAKANIDSVSALLIGYNRLDLADEHSLRGLIESRNLEKTITFYRAFYAKR